MMPLHSLRLPLFVGCLVLIVALPTSGDIYEWEWIDPLDPSQGKQESSMLVPDGTGANAAPGEELNSRDLTMAYLIEAQLTDADLSESTLMDADFTGAVVGGADFSSTVWRGFTEAQLYSTASYQIGELAGIGLGNNDLSGWNFAGKNLSDAHFGYATSYATLRNTNFAGADLSDATFYYAILTDADFTGADLTDAEFEEATLVNVDFTDAVVRGAEFYHTTGINSPPGRGITAPQLYSTASYQTGDLTGIGLGANDLSGWNFAGKNLTDAFFYDSTLTNVNFTGAVVNGVNFLYATSLGFTAAQLYSTASYQSGELTGMNLGSNNLTGWNFAGKNLTDADLGSSTLTNTDFTGAVVSGADLRGTTSRGFLAAQLYSTASYQMGDLARIGLEHNVLTDWNFAGKKLTDTSFYGATLTNADFTGTDTRGASGFVPGGTTIVRNLISPDGRMVDGLHLEATETMRLWDYDGVTPIPIVVEEGMSIDPSATLHAVFDGDAWGSTIAFEAGIDVALGGTLLLEFAEEVNLAEQIGRTIDLFDWDGVSPTGEFAVESSLVWDLTALYASGEVTLVDVGGDFDDDGAVDGVDFLQWQNNAGSGNLTHWQVNYGADLNAHAAATAVPEPATLLQLLAAANCLMILSQRGRRRQDLSLKLP